MIKPKDSLKASLEGIFQRMNRSLGCVHINGISNCDTPYLTNIPTGKSGIMVDEVTKVRKICSDICSEVSIPDAPEFIRQVVNCTNFSDFVRLLPEKVVCAIA